MRCAGWCLLAALAAAMAPPALSAGTVVLARSSSEAVKRTGHIYIQDGSLRMEWASQGPVHTLIYRGKTGTAWVLDDLRRNYIEVDRGALERGGEEAPAHLTYRKVAGGVRVNGFTADQYEALAGAEKVKDLWIVPPAALNIGTAH